LFGVNNFAILFVYPYFGRIFDEDNLLAYFAQRIFWQIFIKIAVAINYKFLSDNCYSAETEK